MTELGRRLALSPGGSLHLELDLDDPEQSGFGDYVLLERLGQGGMGVVYRARQMSLDREVAIKLLSAGPWAAPESIDRFRQEAQSAARLQHPNIVAIHEIGRHEALSYFSMALVRGENLAQIVERNGPLPPRKAAGLVRTIAEALDYSHRLGVLHLDLKPANVLIDGDGEPRVADFGLSRRLDLGFDPAAAGQSGTPGYMAPEQRRAGGAGIGIATDIHGLGAILFELLTGRPPLPGSAATQVVDDSGGRHRAPGPDPGEPLPPDLRAICRTCLAADPRARYASARALIDDLARFLDGRPVSVRPLGRGERLARWASRDPRLAGALALAVLALLAGLVATSVLWRRAELAAGQVRQALWQQRLDDASHSIRAGIGLRALPALVANLAEQQAAGAIEAAGASRIRIGAVLDQAPVLLAAIPSGGSVSQVVLDPDARWLVTVDAQGRLAQRFDLESGNRIWQSVLSEQERPVVLRLTTDGGHLLAMATNYGFPLRTGLHTTLIDLASGRLIDPPDTASGRIIKTHFSPDAAFAVVVSQAEDAQGAPLGRLVRVRDWAELGPSRLLPGPLILAAGGRHLAYRESMSDAGEQAMAVQVLDAATMRGLWTYTPSNNGRLRAWLFSADGERLALGHDDGRVGLFAVADGSPAWLPSRVGVGTGELYFSRDGRWLAAAHDDGQVQVWDAQRLTPVAAPFRPAAEGGDPVTGVVLDPDARRLFAANAMGAWLWQLAADGDSAMRLFARPGHPKLIQPEGNAAALAHGLFAAGSVDGEVRLWRQRWIVPVPAQSPPREIAAANRYFDGRQAVDVRGNQAQVKSLDGRDEVGAVIEFPQPIGFAELLAPGRWLAATSGRELHVVDARHGHPRFPALELAATPAALLVGPAGDRLVLAWNSAESGQAGLALRSVDPVKGTTLGEAQLDHPAWSIGMDERGVSVMAWRGDRLQLLDAASLARRWEVRFGAEHGDAPVRSVALGPDGDTVWVATGVAGADAAYRMHALDAGTGSQRQLWRMPGWAGALRSFAGGAAVVALVPNRRELRTYRLGRHGSQRLAEIPEAVATSSLMLAEDGRRLVVTLDRGVQWFGLPDGEWLTPPLLLPDPRVHLGSASIDPRAATVLLGDGDRRQWLFRLEPDRRSVEILAAVSGVLAPPDDDGGGTIPGVPVDQVLAELAATDPGPPPDPAPPPAVAAPSLRAASSPLIDLRPHCNLPLHESHLHLHLGLRLDRVLPPGRHRLAGSDFQVDCGVLLRYAAGAPASVASGSRSQDIAVPVDAVTAIDLLLLAPSVLLGAPDGRYAVVELRYRDGTVRRTPLLLERDLWTWFSSDPGNRMRRLPVAYTAIGDPYSRGGPYWPAPTLYAVRIENPEPDRDLASLAVESTRTAFSSPVLLAATILER